MAKLGSLTQQAAAPPTIFQGALRESGSRDDIYRLLASADRAFSIDEIGTATGLHPNTIRGHLEVLGAAGIVTRVQGSKLGRGRPPWLYQVVETPLMTERRNLAAELTRELKEAQSPELAEIAAEKWADQVNNSYTTITSETPDQVVIEAGRSLTELGFEVTINPVGDRIDLAKCPYADLVEEHPIICDIHAAFLDQLFANGHQDVSMHQLEVWSREGVCSVLLHRGDQKPARIIPGQAATIHQPPPPAHDSHENRRAE